MIRVFKVLSCLLMLLVSLGGCALNQPSSPVLKIYASFPLQKVEVGQSAINSIKLALSQVNYQVNDYTIELVVKDDGNEEGQWMPEKEEAIALEAIADKQVVAYIGPFNSGAARISIPLTNQGGLMQISPTNTWPGLTKIGFSPGEPGIFYPTGRRNYYRTAPTDDLQAPAAVNWAQQLGFKTVYILDDGEAYGKGLADLFEAFALDSSLTIVGHQTIDKQNTNFTSLLTEIKKQSPAVDLVYFGGYWVNGAPRLIQQMRQSGITAKFMGPDAIVDSAFIQQTGPESEGIYATLVSVPPLMLNNYQGKSFVQSYRVVYNTDPEAFSHLAYDAAKVVVQAIKEAKTVDRAGILQAMSSIGKQEGAAGYFEFDKNGDTTLLVISGNIIKNQKFEFLDILPIR